MNDNDNKGASVILTLLFLLYVVSPVDLLPGPVDDTVLIIYWLCSMLHQ